MTLSLPWRPSGILAFFPLRYQQHSPLLSLWQLWRTPKHFLTCLLEDSNPPPLLSGLSYPLTLLPTTSCSPSRLWTFSKIAYWACSLGFSAPPLSTPCVIVSCLPLSSAHWEQGCLAGHLASPRPPMIPSSKLENWINRWERGAWRGEERRKTS